MLLIGILERLVYGVRLYNTTVPNRTAKYVSIRPRSMPEKPVENLTTQGIRQW